jgi:hypothetical protein
MIRPESISKFVNVPMCQLGVLQFVKPLRTRIIGTSAYLQIGTFFTLSSLLYDLPDLVSIRNKLQQVFIVLLLDTFLEARQLRNVFL